MGEGSGVKKGERERVRAAGAQLGAASGGRARCSRGRRSATRIDLCGLESRSFFSAGAVRFCAVIQQRERRRRAAASGGGRRRQHKKS